MHIHHTAYLRLLAAVCLPHAVGARMICILHGTWACRFNAIVQIASGATLTEVEVDLELTGRRKQQPGFIEPSFPTIAGANGNGAIIHYRAQEGTCK